MKLKLLLLAAAAFLAGAVGLRAQFVWTGSSPTNGSITDPNNWQPHSPAIPVGDGSEDLVFGDHAGSQTIVLVPTAAFNNLNFTGSFPNYEFAPSSGTQVMTLNGSISGVSGSNVTFNLGLDLSLSSGTHTINATDATSVIVFDNNITGPGGLSVTGGSVTFSGSNSYTGGTTVDNGGNVGVTGTINHPSGDFVVGLTSGTSSNVLMANGGQVTDNLGRVGLTDANTTGTVYLDGADTTWNNLTYLYIGELGNGSVIVQNSALLTSANTSIGNNAGGTGFLEVGAGGVVTNSGNIYVGAQGNGTLSVYTGGTLNDLTGSIGNNVGGTGLATVAGAGAVWNNSGDLHVGDAGTGQLFISEGGVVNSASGYVATGAGATGDVGLSGAGSAWNVGNALYVGYGGNGILSVSDGAVVNVSNGNGTIFLGYNSGAVGQLDISSSDGGGGAINAANVTTFNGTGEVVFSVDNTSNDPYYFTKDGTPTGAPVTIGGAITVVNSYGYTVLNGNNTYTGNTVINLGTVVAASNTALGTGSVQFSSSDSALSVAAGVTISNPLQLANGGTLMGNGTFASPVTIGPAVLLAPSSPSTVGALSFSNGLTLGGAGALDFRVQTAGGAAGTGYDVINVTNGALNITATPSSPFKIYVTGLDATGAVGSVADFSASNAYLWSLFTSPGGVTNFSAGNFVLDTSQFSNNLGIGSFSIVQTGNEIDLEFSPVPEPSTYALFASGLGLIGLVWRRRRQAARV